jgi:hypothetical protein
MKELEKLLNIIAWAPCNKKEDRNDKKEKEKIHSPAQNSIHAHYLN